METTVNNAWSRIVAWLKSHAIEDLALLQAPVSSAELDAASAKFGLELPADFVQFYQLMNGTDPNAMGELAVFPSTDEWDTMPYGVMSLDQIIREWEMQKELVEDGEFEDCEPVSAPGVRADWWNVGWIPFASNGGGDSYCVDMAPTEAGTLGQIITHSHESGEHNILAKSLTEYLNAIANGLETSKYEYGEDGLQVVQKTDES